MADSGIKNVLSAIIFLIIALCLIPVVQTFTTNAVGNITDANAKTILGLIPLFYALGVVLVTIAYLIFSVMKKN